MHNTTKPLKDSHIFKLKDAVILHIYPTGKSDWFSQKYKLSRICVSNFDDNLWFDDKIKLFQSCDVFSSNIKILQVGSHCDLYLHKDRFNINYVVGIINIVPPETKSYLDTFFETAYNIINYTHKYLPIPCLSYDTLDDKPKID
jgi:hypothetical protein